MATRHSTTLTLLIAVALIGTGMFPAVAAADTVTFKQGATNAFSTAAYAGTDDATIVSLYSDDNFGAAGLLDSGNYGGGVNSPYPWRTLIRFDLSDFSGDYADITSVTLRLYVSNISLADATATNTSQVYIVDASNAAWVEGTATALAGSDTGSATWDNHTEASQAWYGGAGLGDAGDGYAATPVASVTWIKSDYANGDAVDFTFTGTSAELTAIVDSFANPTNAGMIMRFADETSGPDNNMLRMHSSESAAAYTPELIVGYAVPEPATMAMLGMGGVMMLIRRRRR